MTTPRHLISVVVLPLIATLGSASTPQNPVRFDMGTDDSDPPTAAPGGYLAVTPSTVYVSGTQSYGWRSSAAIPTGVRRSAPAPRVVHDARLHDELLLDAAQSMSPFEFQVDLPAGDYQCVVYLGDLGEIPTLRVPLTGMNVLVNGTSFVTGAFARTVEDKAQLSTAWGGYKRVTFPATTSTASGTSGITLRFETSTTTPCSVMGVEFYPYAEPPIRLDNATGDLVPGTGFSALQPALSLFNDRTNPTNYVNAKSAIDALPTSGNELGKAWGYAWLAGWLTGRQLAPYGEEMDEALLNTAESLLLGLNQPNDFRVTGLLADIADVRMGALFARTRAYANYPDNPDSLHNMKQNLNAAVQLLEQADRDRTFVGSTTLRTASPLRARAQYLIARILYSRNTGLSLVKHPVTHVILNADYNQYIVDLLSAVWSKCDPALPLSQRWYSRAYEPTVLAHYVLTNTPSAGGVYGPMNPWNGTFPAIDYTDTFWYAITSHKTPANAPAWSGYQRRYARMFRALGQWWMSPARRLGPELGGGLGDDPEGAGALAAPTIVRFEGTANSLESGARAVLENVLDTPSINGQFGVNFDQGYVEPLTDVEHSAEFTTNPLFILMPNYWGKPKFLEFAMRTVRNIDEGGSGEWAPFTSGNPQRRFFRSMYFDATRNHMAGIPDYDVVENVKAIVPGFNLIDYNSSPHTRQVFAEYARGWASLALRTDFGKPLGIFPVCYSASTDVIGESGKWYQVNYFFGAPHIGAGEGRMYALLLAAYQDVGELDLLRPIHEAVKFLDTHPPINNEIPGDLNYTAFLLRLAIANSAARAKVDLLAPAAASLAVDPVQLDRVINTYGGSFEKFVNAPTVGGATAKGLVEVMFQPGVSWFEHFWPLASTITSYTDRIQFGPGDSLWGLYATQGGGTYSTVPANVIATQNPDAATLGELDLAILVNSVTPSTSAGGGRLQVLVYNFGTSPRNLDMRILRALGAGTYILKRGDDTDGNDVIDPGSLTTTGVSLAAKGTVLSIAAIPAGKLHVIELEQQSVSTGTGLLPDLAVEESDITRVGNGIEVRVHNLGAVDYVSNVNDTLRVFVNGVFQVAVAVPSITAPGVTTQHPRYQDVPIPGLSVPANGNVKVKLRIQSGITQISTANDEVSVVLP